MTEDHPVKYLTFQGKIAEGEYGAGEMQIWDTGNSDAAGKDTPVKQLNDGHLAFRLHGEKLNGEFNLVRMHGARQSGDKVGSNGCWLKRKTSTPNKIMSCATATRETRTRPNRSRRGPSVEKVHMSGARNRLLKFSKRKN